MNNNIYLYKKIINILDGLKNSHCWCQRGIGNPILKACTDIYKETRKFYNEIKNLIE